jgi:hypothetical protein
MPIRNQLVYREMTPEELQAAAFAVEAFMDSPAGEVFSMLMARYESHIGHEALDDTSGNLDFYRGRRKQINLIITDLKDLVAEAKRIREEETMTALERAKAVTADIKVRSVIQDRAEED